MENIVIRKVDESGLQIIPGRFIGLIDNIGFTAIIDDASLRSRIINSESIPISKLTTLHDLEERRAVFVSNKELVVTEPLGLVNKVTTTANFTSVGITGKDSWWTIEDNVEE